MNTIKISYEERENYMERNKRRISLWLSILMIICYTLPTFASDSGNWNKTQGIAETTETTETTETAETTETEMEISQAQAEHVYVGVATQIQSCLISSSDLNKVTINAKVAAGIATADEKLYLFELKTYESSISGKSPIDAINYDPAKNAEYEFTVDLNNNTALSRLYSKFVVAVKSGNGYTAITDYHYITNPEAIAQNTQSRVNVDSKKGIQVSFNMLSDIDNLGISDGFINFEIDRLVSKTPTNYSYVYNGNTYYFTNLVEDYDNIISKLTSNGTRVTAALIMSYNASLTDLLYTDTQQPGTIYYALNTSNATGLAYVEALTHYLADRYCNSSGTHGQVDNWVIGNEVNDNLQYNYMGEKGVDSYVAEYLQTYRVMYTAIRSTYNNANVYIPLEHRWNTENTNKEYAGMYFLNKFNELSNAQGDMNWALAYHAYSYPMNDPDILNDGQPNIDADGEKTYGAEVTDDVNTPLVTMKNIDVLTDYFQTSAMKNSSGDVRSIILSEQGYTSYSNIYGKSEERQAASIAYAYYKTEMNPYLDSFILRAHIDGQDGNQYYQLGIWNVDANGNPISRKLGYDVYKDIDTNHTLEATSFALDILGIDTWSDVIANFDVNSIIGKKSTTIGQVLSTANMSNAGSSSVLAEKMFDYWNPNYYIHQLSKYDHYGNTIASGTAVCDTNAYYTNYQSVMHKFDGKQDFTATPYLGFGFKLIANPSGSNAGDSMVARVKVYSGNHVYMADSIIKEGTDYNLFVNLDKWQYKNAVDKIQVMVRESEKKTSFDGVFSINNFQKAKSLQSYSAMSSVSSDKINIDNAEFSFVSDQSYTGSAVTPAINIVYGGNALIQGKDYDITYFDNVNFGTARMVIVGHGDFTGSKVVNFKISSTYSAIFDAQYYLNTYADVKAAYGNDENAALNHFLQSGMAEGRQGNKEFNVECYRQNYVDLANAFGDNLPAYYEHYMNYGRSEGRTAMELLQPTVYNGIDYDCVYNKEEYVKYNSDVASAFGDNALALIKHFVNNGMVEGRIAKSSFNVAAYRYYNGDLEAAFGNDNKQYYIHYMNYGVHEGRTCTGVIYDGMDYAPVFDAQFYSSNNPDVVQAVGDSVNSLLSHFVKYGMAEGRCGSLRFDVNVYKEINGDIVAAFGNDTRQYYTHYLKYGQYENRVCEADYVYKGIDYSAVYDKDYYLSNNHDLENAFGNNARALVEHFVNYGMIEGRQAIGTFDVKVYKSNYTDLQRAFGDDLKAYFMHYINFGKSEARKGK